MTTYFTSHNGRVFDLLPTTFVLSDGSVTAADLEQTEGWQALSDRYRLLKQRRFVQEPMPSKQCLLNAWVVKTGARAAGIEVRRDFFFTFRRLLIVALGFARWKRLCACCSCFVGSCLQACPSCRST